MGSGPLVQGFLCLFPTHTDRNRTDSITDATEKPRKEGGWSLQWARRALKSSSALEEDFGDLGHIPFWEAHLAASCAVSCLSLLKQPCPLTLLT